MAARRPNTPPKHFHLLSWRSLGIAACAAAMALAAPSAHAERSCDDWHADLVSVEGSVEVLRQSTGAWTPVKRGDIVCTGDTVQVRESGRALIHLPDDSALRLEENTSFRLPEPKGGVGTIVDLIRGAIHVISRDPRSLTFRTPYMNAGLEGTEFDLRVADEKTTVAVLEGQVLATNSSGTTHVPSGHVATAGAGQKPESAPAEPIALMRWTSYYAKLIDGPLPAADAAPSAAQSQDVTFFTGRAAARLGTGRLAAAEEDLATGEQLARADPTVPALRSVIAVARGAPAQALQLARSAVALAPDAAVPLIALSYAQQASAETTLAATTAQHAADVAPTDAIAWARLAELKLATGDVAAAMAAADRSRTLRPTLGYPDTVLGFAHLAQLDSRTAAADFRQAAELDQASPLPHLGLGLALVLDGDVTAGRREIETAVALDPASATMRSYVAKAYDTENRDKLTASQLDLAKRLNPSDPTPWLYDALHQLNENRPVEALKSLNAAIDLNDNAPVFRSTLGMDEDQATRSAGIGRVYRELNFEQLALNRGWQAVAADPKDYAGHRLLADVYTDTPRHEIVRVNELLQSQLLQPVNLRPLRPDLALPNLFIVDTGDDRSFSEFSPLLTKNGLRFEGSTVTSGNDTVGEDLVLSGLHDRLSYSFGQFRFKTDGFRPNNDLDQRVANAFVQYRPNYETSLQAELRSTETHKGDLALLFDPETYLRTLRVGDSDDSLRLGLRRDLSSSGTLLASVIFRAADTAVTRGPNLFIGDKRRGYSVDVQHIHEAKRWRLSSGVLLAHERVHEKVDAVTALPQPPFQVELHTVSNLVQRQSALYGYALFDVTRGATLTLGASYNSLSSGSASKSAFNPKVAVTWRPTDRTVIRAATFRTLEGSLSTSKQDLQPRLEPGQVAGFSQFLLGANGDEARVDGLGLDQKITANLFAGVELSKRSFDRRVVIAGTNMSLDVRIHERLDRAYLYWMPVDRIAFSSEYQRENFDSHDFAFYGATELHAHRVPLELHYFAPFGITAGLRASRVSQEGRFDTGTTPPGVPLLTEPGRDRFWMFDASLSYRLPNRRGMVSLSVANLLDRKFQFQDIDPENPSFMPERMVSLRATIAIE